MKHKFGKPKCQRAGCLICKPWKAMGNSENAMSIDQKKKLDIFKQQINEARDIVTNYRGGNASATD